MSLALTTPTSDNSSAGDRQDAIAALASLGYKSHESGRVIRELPSDLSSEEMIRQALRVLSGKVL